MSVRKLRQGEFKAAVKLLQELLAEEGPRNEPGVRMPPDRALVTAHEVFVVEAPFADAGERLVGIALALHVTGDGFGEVGWLYVRPSFRRRGVGKELLDAACAYLIHEKRCTRIRVAVFEGNRPAALLYNAAGFKPVFMVMESVSDASSASGSNPQDKK